MRTTRLVRTSLLLACCLCGTPFGADAQDTTPISLDSLRPPPSAAFVLLGVTPSAVQRPSTPRAISTSFLSAAREAGGIPDSYAVEFAPYWLSSRPSLTLADYETERVWPNLRRSLSVSFATAERERGPDGNPLPGTRFGIGVRALPLKGVRGDSADILLGQLRQVHLKCLPVDDTEACLEDTTRDLALRIQKALRDRYGWSMEVAVGAALDFPDDNFAEREIQRAGVWITPAYRAKDSPLQAIVVGRYLRDLAEKDENVLDFGARLYWQLEQVAVSGELLERWSGDGWRNSERLSGTVEFQISEDLYATYTLGRDFASPTGQGRLLSVLGLNIGLGREPTVQAPTPRPAPAPTR